MKLQPLSMWVRSEPFPKPHEVKQQMQHMTRSVSSELHGQQGIDPLASCKVIIMQHNLPNSDIVQNPPGTRQACHSPWTQHLFPSAGPEPLGKWQLAMVCFTFLHWMIVMNEFREKYSPMGVLILVSVKEVPKSSVKTTGTVCSGNQLVSTSYHTGHLTAIRFLKSSPSE